MGGEGGGGVDVVNLTGPSAAVGLTFTDDLTIHAETIAQTNKVIVSGATLARQTVQGPVLRLSEADSKVFMLRPDVPVVQLVLQAVNPGDIGYFLYGKDLGLTLGNWPMATEDMSPVPLAAGQSSRIDILFYPNLHELTDDARVALEAALGGYTTLVRLDGELFMDVLGVDSFPVPGGWSVTGFVR